MDASKDATEASKMLEAALQQMDGIISSATIGSTAITPPNTNATSLNINSTADPAIQSLEVALNRRTSNEHINPIIECNLISPDNILSTAKTLALALQQVGLTTPAPDAITASIISDWLKTSHLPHQDVDERYRKLQRDNESLVAQYQLLVNKISIQADKIIELEGLLTDKTQQLSAKEELLQRQICTRSELETQKLELKSALSELKLHRAAIEKENFALSNLEQLQNSPNILKHSKQAVYGSVDDMVQSHIFNANKPKTPPITLRYHQHPHFHSLPRSHCTKVNRFRLPWTVNQNGNNNNNNSNNNGNEDNGDKLSNNRQLLDANGNKQIYVVFASNEKILIDDDSTTTSSHDIHNNNNNSSNNNIDNLLSYDNYIERRTTFSSTGHSTLRERSTKSIRHLFNKLRRSNSSNFELPNLENLEVEFRRGDRSRVTAGGRIEWSSSTTQSSTVNTKNWSEWTIEDICHWLSDLGLSCYIEECRKWLKHSKPEAFFAISTNELIDGVNIKVHLHRKKILLALEELKGKETDTLALQAAQLDVNWVMRWLDDIGLPQYKDNFFASKIDGRLLHRLTMEELLQLRVTSCLHIASLRCAIQCMREMDWNPECLIRRSTKMTKQATSVTELDIQKPSMYENETEERIEFVALWTAHRVMEWLRAVDLSEYAPNLRGAGVHGALMLYEPRFNANLLADLLSIPSSKTLLRRHLATHFKELLGREIIQEKREIEGTPGYQQLTITAKLKVPKKNQFSLRKHTKTKSTMESNWTDYVCPLSKQLDKLDGSNEEHIKNSVLSTSTITTNTLSIT